MSLTLEAPPLPLQEQPDGTVRVGGTRVTLDVVIAAYHQGLSPEQIVDRFDVLQLADVHAVIAYYLRNREEVNAYLRRRQEEADELRRQMEALYPPEGIRARLLARRAAGSK